MVLVYKRHPSQGGALDLQTPTVGPTEGSSWCQSRLAAPAIYQFELSASGVWTGAEGDQQLGASCQAARGADETRSHETLAHCNHLQSAGSGCALRARHAEWPAK